MSVFLRHMGLVARDLKLEVEFLRKLGMLKLSPRPVTEIWRNNELKVMKFRDSGKGILEIIEGEWKPHVSVTVSKSFEDIWVDYAIKADVMIEYKRTPRAEILYLKSPNGNYYEVVRER